MRLQELQSKDEMTEDDREAFTGTIRAVGEGGQGARVQGRCEDGRLIEFYCSKPTAPTPRTHFYLRAQVTGRRRWKLKGRREETKYSLDDVRRFVYSSGCFECGEIVVISRTVEGRRGEVLLLEVARPYHRETVAAEVAPGEMEEFLVHECD